MNMIFRKDNFCTDSLHQQNLSVQIPESKAYNSVAYLKNASFSKHVAAVFAGIIQLNF